MWVLEFAELDEQTYLVGHHVGTAIRAVDELEGELFPLRADPFPDFAETSLTKAVGKAVPRRRLPFHARSRQEAVMSLLRAASGCRGSDHDGSPIMRSGTSCWVG